MVFLLKVCPNSYLREAELPNLEVFNVMKLPNVKLPKMETHTGNDKVVKAAVGWRQQAWELWSPLPVCCPEV
jgi:hypothetical protein